MQYAAWLRDRQRKNHKGIPPALQICDPCSRPALAGWQASEQELLESCYRTSLNLAKENGCQSVAFPLISSGIYGYPKDQALKVAVDTISTFLLENEMMVYIVIFDRKAYQISGKLFADIAAYIDDRYVEEHTDSRAEQRRRLEALSEESCFEAAPVPLPPEAICKSCSSQSLEEALGQIDEKLFGNAAAED